MAPERLAEMITEVMDEAAAARRVWNMVEPDDPERWLAERRMVRRLRALQRRLELDFGAAHGWRLSRTTFGLVTLSLGKRHGGNRSYDEDQGNGHWRGDFRVSFDHPCYYRRDGKAAAIVSHLYGWPEVRPAARLRRRITG
jgi:hypothetical protein